jgi:hypothetical protein
MNKVDDVESQQHNVQQQQQQQHAVLGKHVMNGLTIAGIASAILVTIFRMFHVDVFLGVYELPLSTYSRASAVFSIVHTANNVVGAWVVDELAIRMDRSHLIGVSGCIFALLFLTPFFRWPKLAEPSASESSSSWWDGVHFVVSLSLYDALYAFTTILLGSVLTDSHNLTDKQRVQFMASGKVYNLLATFLVARIALSLFDTDNLYRFRIFLILLALISSVFFVHGQFVIMGHRNRLSWKSWLEFGTSLQFFSNPPVPIASPSKNTLLHQQRKQALRRRRNSQDENDMDSHVNNQDEGFGHASSLKKQLQWRRVMRDFASMPNFRSWVVMEMLLEAQVTFSSTFLKTFMDRLVMESQQMQRLLLQAQQQQQPKLDDINDDNTGRGDNVMMIDNINNASSSTTGSAGASSTSSAFSRETCDWLLSMIGPLSQIACIFCYIPIRKVGYPRVYTSLFVVNLLLSTLLLLVADGSCAHWIALFLTVYTVLPTAVQSAGFHLAMSDMVLEMKRRHFIEGRYNEPSLAALFMGANALFCKPMESILPIIAASVMETTTSSTMHHAQQQRQLGDVDVSTITDMEEDATTKNNFFYLLVLPPFFFSIIQLLAWQTFNLTPTRTAAMRQDLRHLQLQANSAMTAAKAADSHRHPKMNKISSPGPPD